MAPRTRTGYPHEGPCVVGTPADWSRDTPCAIPSTGVPRSQQAATPEDPTVGLYLGSCGGPGLGAVSYKRGTPVLSLIRNRLQPDDMVEGKLTFNEMVVIHRVAIPGG